MQACACVYVQGKQRPYWDSPSARGARPPSLKDFAPEPFASIAQGEGVSPEGLWRVNSGTPLRWFTEDANTRSVYGPGDIVRTLLEALSWPSTSTAVTKKEYFTPFFSPPRERLVLLTALLVSLFFWPFTTR